MKTGKFVLGVCVLVGMSATIVACGKKPQAPAENAGTADAAATAPAASAPAAPTPEATEADAKKQAIARALAEQAILEDAKGQWAVAATASSTYSADKAPTSTTGYAPMQATGKPDVESYGDNDHSWVSEQADGGIEWLQVDFAKPVSAHELRIRQNCAPGAIIKLELIDEGGARHTIWEGADDAVYDSTIAWFVRGFEPTTYKAKSARITLATNAVSGWNEIDAVQLVGE